MQVFSDKCLRKFSCILNDNFSRSRKSQKQSMLAWNSEIPLCQLKEKILRIWHWKKLLKRYYMLAKISGASSWASFGKHMQVRSVSVIITFQEHHILSFHDDEVSKDVRFVEEVVMEGNPKAPRFLVEPHIEPPREAFVQHVRLITWILLWILLFYNVQHCCFTAWEESLASCKFFHRCENSVKRVLRKNLFLDYVASSWILLARRLSWGESDFSMVANFNDCACVA